MRVLATAIVAAAVLAGPAAGEQELPKPRVETGLAPSTNQGSLYAVVVGVIQYPDPYRGDESANDARDFAVALQQQEGRLYRKAEVRVLTGEDARKQPILEALVWLKQQAGKRDAGLIFLSGHGVTAGGGTPKPGEGYYFVPYAPTGRWDSPDTSLTAAEIGSALKQLAGRRFFFFDTNRGRQPPYISAIFPFDTLASQTFMTGIAHDANAFVLSGAMGKGYSEDHFGAGGFGKQHGAFVEALIEGMAGAADAEPKDGIVTAGEFSRYVKRRVNELTRGYQHPADAMPENASAIPFAAVP
jgi:hypothetical protein